MVLFDVQRYIISRFYSNFAEFKTQIRMKFGKITVILALAAFLSTGCDFFRSVCGKPTSADIQRIVEERAAAEKARQDSIALAERLRAEQELAAHFSGVPQGRYNLVAASFGDSLNAVAFRSQLEQEGFDARLLKLRNGMISVSLFYSEDKDAAQAEFRRIRALPSYRHDLCLYDARREIEKIQQQTIISQ